MGEGGREKERKGGREGGREGGRKGGREEGRREIRTGGRREEGGERDTEKLRERRETNINVKGVPCLAYCSPSILIEYHIPFL